MDGFEKHIKDHREQFEEHKADREKMWRHISGELDGNEKIIPIWKRRWLQIAAGLIILIGIIGVLRLNNMNDQKVAQSSNVIQIDLYYEHLVARHVQMVYDNPNLNEIEKREFLDFMKELDEEYVVLKTEMESDLDNEKVLEAIINNYKKRIEIIENLLIRINQSKNTDNEQGILL